MKNKRLVAGLLALTFVFGGAALPTGLVSNNTVISASADSTVELIQTSKTYGDFQYWEINHGEEVEIIAYEGSETNVEIPSEINGKPVTSIGDKAFYACEKIVNVVIPDSVTNIGSYAFSGCKFLEHINIPYGIKTIPICAFSNCYFLDNITIPNSVTKIECGAFTMCQRLRSISIPDSVTYIGIDAFSSCYMLNSVRLSNNITSIESGTFSLCKYLTTINIPDGVTTIGRGAFNECERLTSVFMPEGLISIETSAFEQCYKLANAKIPESVRNIGRCAFFRCEKLMDVTIPDGVTSITYGTFEGCTSLKTVTIPDSVNEITKDAFSQNLSLYLEDKPIENLIIKCYENSYAHQYALENEIKYEFLTKEIIDVDPGHGYIANRNPIVSYDKGDNSVTLNWEAVDGAEEYAVESYINGEWKQVYQTKNTSYVLDGLKVGTEYNVAVIAKFNGEWNSDYSNAIVVTPNEAKQISYPEVTEIAYSEPYHQFRLTWTPVDGADKYGIAAFIAGKWRVQTYTDKTTFTSPKLKAGDTYKLLIAARVNGEWDLSNINSRAFTVTVK